MIHVEELNQNELQPAAIWMVCRFKPANVLIEERAALA